MSEAHSSPYLVAPEGALPTTPIKRTRKRRSQTALDVEAKAIGDCYLALAPLGTDTAAIERVMNYVRARLGFPQ